MSDSAINGRLLCVCADSWLLIVLRLGFEHDFGALKTGPFRAKFSLVRGCEIADRQAQNGPIMGLFKKNPAHIFYCARFPALWPAKGGLIRQNAFIRSISVADL
ncbi:hypothetical protein ACQZ61_14410 [Agrobacterium vitis]|uniref:Uncharacterized protein n=1 Tax=Agrobacterium vitis TaxID=373 RepID=A0A6L6VL94_AGRVI|nr:hypothetical protein [Agrobacterium vitis]MCF1453620.1 hypothetical protein [Agrobacterium vitis]MUZ74182.1 hypothetical protein [Agrobacterium vitis]MVA55489.1 hypothetical protein [Agrobacterium vitis]